MKRRIKQPPPPTVAQRLLEPFQTKGRYRRDAFWFCFVVFGIPATFMQNWMTLQLMEWVLQHPGDPVPWWQFAPATTLLLLMSWISLAATIKRLHDRNKSWVWSLAGSIPVIGLVYIAIECGFRPSVDVNNRYGREAASLSARLFG